MALNQRRMLSSEIWEDEKFNELKANEKFIWNIKVSVAQYYIDNLSEEVRKGQKEKIDQGWLPHKPPRGYINITHENRKIAVIDKSTAPMIIEAFKLYASGNYSLKALNQKMYEQGLRTKSGGKLSKSRLAAMLNNSFYYGKIEWSGDLYPGKHEPLISKELYEAVQQRLKSKSTPSYTKHFYILRKLIKCAECDGTITWEKQKGTIYGHCNHYRECTQTIWIKEPDIEEQLINALKPLRVKNERLQSWIRKALKQSHSEKIEYHESTVGEINKQLEKIQQRIERLYDDKLDNIISADFYDRKARQFQEQKDTLLSSLSQHESADTKYYEGATQLYDIAQTAELAYQKKTAEDKRKLLQLVFNGLQLNDGKLSYKYSEPFELLHKATALTNKSSKQLNTQKTVDKIFERQFDTGTKQQNRVLDPVLNNLQELADTFGTFDWPKLQAEMGTFPSIAVRYFSWNAKLLTGVNSVDTI